MGYDHHPTQKAIGGFENSEPEDIKDCFEAYAKPSKLDKDNAWYCNVCKDHVEATKTIEIYNVPPIMIICLQRFKSHNNYFKEKLEDKVSFPVTGLDMG